MSQKKTHLPEIQSAESFARTEICCKTDALKAFTMALPFPADASVFHLRPHSGEKKECTFNERYLSLKPAPGSGLPFLHFNSFLGFFLPFQSAYFAIICFRFQAGSSARVVYNFSSNNPLRERWWSGKFAQLKMVEGILRIVIVM